MVIAEDREAPTVAESGNFPEGFVVNRFGDSDDGRVRGADGEIFVDVAQPPFVCLEGRKIMVN